ncbi:MAG TPA: hypothetical protein VFM48_13700, partial [Aquabacterium sp.]|nr:hypothetical protein [Aquabacterium sp.]
MSLGQIGIATTQDELGKRVFLPGRSGTLQTEMLAGPRQLGAVSFQLNPDLQDLIVESTSGHAP